MAEPASEEEAALLNSEAVEVNDFPGNAENGQPLKGLDSSATAAHNVHDARLDLNALPTHDVVGTIPLAADIVEDDDDDDEEAGSQVDEGEDEWEVDDDDDESAYEELLEGLTDETLHARSGMSARDSDSLMLVQILPFFSVFGKAFIVCPLSLSVAYIMFVPNSNVPDFVLY